MSPASLMKMKRPQPLDLLRMTAIEGDLSQCTVNRGGPCQQPRTPLFFSWSSSTCGVDPSIRTDTLNQALPQVKNNVGDGFAWFAWLIRHGWKYCWLICCKRKYCTMADKFKRTGLKLLVGKSNDVGPFRFVKIWLLPMLICRERKTLLRR
jgi:hypothetical protein